MLKENWRFISRVQRVADLCIVFFAFVLAYYGRSSLVFWNEYFDLKIPFQGEELAPLKDYFLVLIAGLFSYALLLSHFGAYGSMRLADVPRLLYRLFATSVLVFFVLASVVFLFKLDLSRSFIVLFCLLSGLFLTGERYVVLAALRYWRRRGRNFRNIMIVGGGLQAVRLTQEILKRPELGVGIKAYALLRMEQEVDPHDFELFLNARQEAQRYVDSKVRNGRSGEKIVQLNGVKEVELYLQSEAIDELIFTDVVPVMKEVEELVRSCAERGIRTTIAGDLFSVGIIRSDISYFGGMPLIHFQTPPGDNWCLSLKRVVDVVVSLFLMIVLSPLYLLIAVAVKLSSPGPMLFKQKRVGLNGRRFSLYKFRSMRVGAEAELEDLKAYNEMNGPVFKMSNDPRVTLVGRFLRRYSLDELPQLWNVLRGDMSLVGPRPPIPGEVSLYERTDRRRLSMRPGLTCTWQVGGRNHINDFESWVKLDLEYIDNWSLSSDFLLLLRTIPVVLLGQGAK